MGRPDDNVRGKQTKKQTLIRVVEVDDKVPLWKQTIQNLAIAGGLGLLLLLFALTVRLMWPVTEVVTIVRPLTPSQNARMLGLPAKYAGFTLVDTHGPGSTLRHETKCPNCGWDAPVVTISWPEAPGVGWGKYDLGTQEYRDKYDLIASMRTPKPKAKSIQEFMKNKMWEN